MWWGKQLSAERENRNQEGARFALLVLCAVQVLSYADRYVPAAVKTQLKNDLHLSDTQTALPTTSMVLVYMVAAFPFSWLVDKQMVDSRSILGISVALWSLATAISGLSQSIEQLVFFRSFVGLGEAALAVIGPQMLADFYCSKDRLRVYLLFYSMCQFGAGVGFISGACIGSLIGWRAVFLVCGVPGIFLACLIPRINNPARGVNDDDRTAAGHAPGAPCHPDRSGTQTSSVGEFRELLSYPHYVSATCGMVAFSFTIGGEAEWFQTLLMRSSGASAGQVGLAVSIILIVGGIGGAVLGSEATAYLEPSCKNAQLLVPALFMLPAALSVFIATCTAGCLALSCTFWFLGMLCGFTFTAPIQTITMNAVPADMRARASSVSVLLSHVLGDMLSPPIVGLVSDATGQLAVGMHLLWLSLLVAALAWGAGYLLLDPLPEIKGGAGTGPPLGTPSTFGALLCGAGEGLGDGDVAAHSAIGEGVYGSTSRTSTA